MANTVFEIDHIRDLYRLDKKPFTNNKITKGDSHNFKSNFTTIVDKIVDLVSILILSGKNYWDSPIWTELIYGIKVELQLYKRIWYRCRYKS